MMRKPAQRLALLIAASGAVSLGCLAYESLLLQRTPAETTARTTLTDLAMALDSETIGKILSPANTMRGAANRAALRTLLPLDVASSLGSCLLAVGAVLFMRCSEALADRAAKIGVWLLCCSFLAMAFEAALIGSIIYSGNPEASSLQALLLAAAARVRRGSAFLNAGLLCWATCNLFAPSYAITMRSLPRLLGSKDAMLPTLYGFSSVVGLLATAVPQLVFLLPLANTTLQAAWAGTTLFATAFYFDLKLPGFEEGFEEGDGAGAATSAGEAVVNALAKKTN